MSEALESLTLMLCEAMSICLDRDHCVLVAIGLKEKEPVLHPSFILAQGLCCESPRLECDSLLNVVS